MTREEAIKTLKGKAWLCCTEKWNEALEIAIKALEQEPSGDLISRQELLEDLYKRDYTKFTHRDFVALVQYQDTVQQEPKTGYWIAVENEEMETVGYFCSECDLPMETEQRTNYCPNCGCRMESEGEEC